MVDRPESFGLLGAIEAFDVDPANTKIALTTVQGVFEPPLLEGEGTRPGTSGLASASSPRP